MVTCGIAYATALLYRLCCKVTCWRGREPSRVLPFRFPSLDHPLRKPIFPFPPFDPEDAELTRVFHNLMEGMGHPSDRAQQTTLRTYLRFYFALEQKEKKTSVR